MEFEPISFDEYEAAYRRFVACLDETGVGITEYGLDPEHQRFEYATEGGDPEVERSTGRIPADDCYDREFADADMRWQYQQERTNTFDTVGQRIARLATSTAPEPWEHVGNVAIGGLLAIGFSHDDRYCLVVSDSGRSVVDTRSGEEVARDDDGLESYVATSRLESMGIGPLAGVAVSIAGVWGGGLRTSTSDGWWIFRCAPEWPHERIVLQAPDANLYNSYRGLTQLDAPDTDVRAVGFAPNGSVLISATRSEVKVWQRSHGETENETPTDSVRA